MREDKVREEDDVYNRTIAVDQIQRPRGDRPKIGPVDQRLSLATII